nr:hypothetical protein [Salsipaludibacter albus]
MATIADAVVAAAGGDGPLRVGVDGVDGSGKTHFADELAAVLAQRDLAVARASIDGFHRPAAARYRRGRTSPEGFYHDSYDLDALRGLLLDPLAPGGDRQVVRAIHDVDAERPVPHVVEDLSGVRVVVVDGIFLHRPELRDSWDFTVFLDVDFAVSVARMAGRDGGDPSRDSPSNRRYVEGQRLYLAGCDPRRRATVVVDNDDLADAHLVPATARDAPLDGDG